MQAPEQPSPIDESARIARIARFVLAHRRLVIVAWLVVFLAGAASASHVSKRLAVDFSLPGQPGYETSLKIARIYGNGGEEPPALAVLTVPAGHTVAGERGQIAAAVRAHACRLPRGACARLRQRRGPAHDHARRAHHVPDPVHAAGEDLRHHEDPRARGARARRLAAARYAGTAHGPRAALKRRRNLRQPGSIPGDDLRRPRRAGGAGVRVRLNAGVRAADDRGSGDPHHAAGDPRPHLYRRRVLHRAVPRLARRPRRGDRLLAVDRHALARGARARALKPRRGGRGDGHRRARRGAVRASPWRSA